MQARKKDDGEEVAGDRDEPHPGQGREKPTKNK